MDPQLYFMQQMNLPSWPINDIDAWLPDRWKQAHAAGRNDNSPATSFGKDAVARDEWPSFLRVNECERRSGASKRKRAIG
jgi:hypothetical protein